MVAHGAFWIALLRYEGSWEHRCEYPARPGKVETLWNFVDVEDTDDLAALFQRLAVVVAKHRSVATRGDKKLDVTTTLDFTVEGDKIARIDESTSDQAAEDAFWS